jgi:hypothetical protein
MFTSVAKFSVVLAAVYGAVLASGGLAHAQSSAPATPAGSAGPQVASATAGSFPTNASESAKLRSERFTPVTDVATFPDACKKAFATLTKERTFALANPGQPFQATDVMSMAKLPWRRLILGGTTPDRCIVYYEKGGFATSYAAVLFDISKVEEPTMIWRGVGGGAPHDLPELVSSVTTGGFKQGEQNGW